MDDDAFKRLMLDAAGDQARSAGREMALLFSGFYKGLRDNGVPTQAAIPMTVAFIAETLQHQRWMIDREGRKP